ncbi:helix-turn-helix domain-containing protein [Actinosynnema pretiosum]|uniref:HTH cro/C1-type domain-containing protein n=1 Tax=Actinosynnema pretiosum TaxID=42197 RepID=A0A290ZAJ1_9PSEU|nr:helix-turn-helix transcriptional regulator [Actinosynnema pretiosum]ATE55993.1 hypothetical protein CNX65_24205 [Actinosynnema pretiosum]
MVEPNPPGAGVAPESRDWVLEFERVGSREEFTALLRGARSAGGRSIRELARAADVPASTLGGYFSGRHLPLVGRADQVVRVLERCGATGDGLIGAVRAALEKAHRAPPGTPGCGAVPPPERAERISRGREELTRTVLEALAELPAGGALVVLGAGETPLLRAEAVVLTPVGDREPARPVLPWSARLARGLGTALLCLLLLSAAL